LGRTSHAAYIRFLENQHKRLEAIKGRSHQQQKQLDDVEMALKSARDAVNGQFNLGDIKIPTPYEVKRYIATSTAGLGMSGSAGGNVIINIDGADVGMVREVLRKEYGASVLATAGTSNSKS
jgi:hypothetical protein